MGSVRSEDPINRQRQTARGAGIRDYGHSSAPVGPTLTMAGSPRTGRMRRMGPKLPHTLTSENNCLPAARCIRATRFGKIDEPAVCAIARSCLDPKNQPVACLAVQHGSGGAFGGDGIMNPRRFTTVAPAFCGTVVLAGVDRRLAGWLRFGRHREHPRSANRGPRSISRRQRQARG